MSSSQILSFCNLLYFYCNVKNCSWEGFSFVAFRQGSSHCSVLPRNIGVLADFSHYKCRKLLPFFLYFYIFSDEASSIFHVVHCQSLSVRQGSTAFCLWSSFLDCTAQKFFSGSFCIFGLTRRASCGSIIFASNRDPLHTERCPSGLRSWSWKPVTRKGRGFESHSLRQLSYKAEQFGLGEVPKWPKGLPC